ncbi:acyltransferase [Roseateles sp. DC23W]|uniref:Acyltransferase n=1 Tax=Pelomonas dachongensis TaxID=3299029 RepID=A0ABW7ESZ0_9BURK
MPPRDAGAALMALWPYRIEAAAARLRALLWRLRGLAVGQGAAVHGGVRLRFGAGSALGARSVLYRDVQLLATGDGRFRIGRDSHLAPGAYVLVGGQTLDIGDDVAIGPGLMLFCESNDAGPDGLFRTQYRRAPVRIGSNVFIGARVTVLPGAVIDDHVVVAAHAVVSGRLASGWVYGGCPARPLRPLRHPAAAS